MKRIYFERPWEFWVALITAAIVIWSVEIGILMAIFLSLVAHTRHGYRPKNMVVFKRDSDTGQECESAILIVTLTAYRRAGVSSCETLNLIRQGFNPVRRRKYHRLCDFCRFRFPE